MFNASAELLFPVAFEVEQPVINACVTQLQALAESIVIYGSIGSHRHWCCWVSPALWVVWSKWRQIYKGIGGQESRVTFPVVVRVTKSCKDAQIFQRHP